MERKQSIEGTTKPRGGHRYLPFAVTVYLVLTKTRCLNLKKCQKRYTGGFYSSLWYIERKLANEGTTKPRGGDRYTVYCYGIPLSGKTFDIIFLLTEFLTTYVFSSSSKRPIEQHIHPLSRVIHSRKTYMTTYVCITARNSQQKTQSTRDTTQPTSNAEHT